MLKIWAELTPTGMFWITLSCVVGVCISWAGFWCQSLITATAYTVVGVMNKMLTVRGDISDACTAHMPVRHARLS